MGNKPVEKKRKKKGRPSLLDLQKRNLRLQKQQQQQQQQQKKNPNPSPSPNPYVRFPAPSSGRRITRRNPNPEPDADPPSADDEDDEDGSLKRREKKLKLVLRIPNPSANSASESDGDDDDPEQGKRRSISKGTDPRQGEPLDSGPTTPLPDKKLLVFILDRLQKKDTYSVFSEPVDSNELPDYHEVIKHPMDFGTVRNKLSSGAYANLEQFETYKKELMRLFEGSMLYETSKKDVFLICSNAMRYNAPDTIYHRQARTIQELAKKNFENLRQESDDNEPEPKTVVRRGRPPSKNIKRTVGRPPADRAASDFSSDATLANAGEGAQWSNLNHDSSRKGLALDRAGIADASTRASYNLRNTEPFSWAGVHKSETNEGYTGYVQKGVSTKYGKKIPVVDENRRDTYKQPQPFTSARESSMLTAFDGEKKQLMPIAVHMDYAYARSLTRFAANLGPVGWAIASKKIERILPPGTKFGRGWVGDSEAPHQSQPPLPPTSSPCPSSIQAKISPCTTILQGDRISQTLESPCNDPATKEGHVGRTTPPVSTPPPSNRPPDSMEVGVESARGLSSDGGSHLLACGDGGGGDLQCKAPFQLHQNPGIRPTSNGFNTGTFAFNLSSQIGKTVRPHRPPGPFVPEAPMTHARALDMVSRGNHNGNFILQTPMNHLEAERGRLVRSSGTTNPGNSLPDSGQGQDSHGPRQNLLLQPKQDSVPPDLNVRFHSPGSPASGVMVDSQQPDLALQL